MSQEHQEPIYRTSGERTAKMMAIMLGLCIVGGAIFFGMWDYWISDLAPVVAMKKAAQGDAPSVVATGVEIPTTLTFVESKDFRVLAFNALPGEPGSNPTITANVGDKIIFDVTNAGKSFHSFGVTADEEGFEGIIPGSEIASASNPLKAGQGGTSEFIPSKEGIFYYICTVPGHRIQGMVGEIIVGDVKAPEAPKAPEEPKPEPTTMPTPESQVPEMIEKPIPKDEPKSMTPFTGTISLPAGSALPGCEETNECYIPAEVTISTGTKVTWSNDDTAAHTVTSGDVSEGPDGNFDSSLFGPGKTFEHTFESAGEYPYYCMVHPWMTGKVIVN